MFDLPTLIAVMAVSQILMAGVLLFVWRLNRQVPAAGYWFFGVLVILMGSILLLLRQVAPPWITMVLANVFLVAGYMVHLAGIRRYTGRKAISWYVLVGPLAIFAILFLYFSYIDPDISQRIFIYGLFGGSVSLLSAREGLRKGQGRNMATVFYGLMSAFHGSFLLMRGINTSLLHVEDSFLSGATMLTQVVFFEGIIITVLVGVSFILLTTEYLAHTLRKLSERDPLTDVFNRRVFFDLAEKAVSYARRKNLAVSLLVLDLDHFKKINDSYGHSAGDDVLRAFTKTVEGQLRKEDVIGRLGGEEFGILLPEANMDGALDIATRICQACENLTVRSGETAIQFTVSIGVAELDEDIDVPAMFQRADQALYGAKNAGRNRVGRPTLST